VRYGRGGCPSPSGVVAITRRRAIFWLATPYQTSTLPPDNPKPIWFNRTLHPNATQELRSVLHLCVPMSDLPVLPTRTNVATSCHVHQWSLHCHQPARVLHKQTCTSIPNPLAPLHW
jgi:hypothetical protein